MRERRRARRTAAPAGRRQGSSRVDSFQWVHSQLSARPISARHFRLLLYGLQLELGVQLQLEIPEADLHGAAAVDLDADASLRRDLVVLEVRAEIAVDRRADPVAHDEDLIDVPFGLLDELVAVERLALLREEQAARGLLVEQIGR